ncbi:MAG TPA: nuclear transport factor 2 family protein [Thermomicrobiales bacterium]|nr:nuclear transport factor 2 family protein [Thermomicrobiales bacterium]
MGQARHIVEQWWSLFEADRLEDTAEICQSDVEVILPGVEGLRGPAEAIATLQAFREAFPDIQHQFLDSV